MGSSPCPFLPAIFFLLTSDILSRFFYAQFYMLSLMGTST